jgi:hypothetical protein
VAIAVLANAGEFGHDQDVIVAAGVVSAQVAMK